MKKNNRLLYLIIAILVIWNVSITVFLINNKLDNNNEQNVIETNVTGFATDLTKVVETSKSSVVVVSTSVSTATGVIFNNNGDSTYVVTTCHSVDDNLPITIIFASGATFDGQLIGKDIFADIAVIKVDTNVDTNPIKLGNSNIIKNGEIVVCIGTPVSSAYANTNEIGIISNSLISLSNSINYEEKTIDYISNMVQLSSGVTHGYSGAPVLNMAGEMIALVTMKNETAVFALPTNEIKIIVENIISGNEYEKIQLGIKGLFVEKLETYEKNQLNIPLDVNSGYYVNNVRSLSLANSLEIKEGDIIISINDISINNNNDLLSFEYSNTDSLTIQIIRNNENITLVGNIND